MKKPEVKRTAGGWINHVNRYPHLHGRSEKDIKQVNKIMRQTEGSE